MIISRANEILKEDNISPEEKLLRTFMAMRIDNQVANWIPEEMHKTESNNFYNCFHHRNSTKDYCGS